MIKHISTLCLTFFCVQAVFGNSYQSFIIGSTKVFLHKGDITQVPVHAVVNAANSNVMKFPGGVAGAIYKAAGSHLYEFMKMHYRFISLGDAVISPSFDLQKNGIQHIIHTVGPDFRCNQSLQSLSQAYMSSLRLAKEHRVQSLAFPPISTGIFGGDLKKCAQAAANVIVHYPISPELKEIWLCFFDDAYAIELENALKTALSNSENF